MIRYHRRALIQHHGGYTKMGATISLIYLLGMLVIWLAPEIRHRTLPN